MGGFVGLCLAATLYLVALSLAWKRLGRAPRPYAGLGRAGLLLCALASHDARLDPTPFPLSPC